MSVLTPEAVCEISGTGLPAEVRVAFSLLRGISFLNAARCGLLYRVVIFFNPSTIFFISASRLRLTSWLSSLPE